MEKLRLTNQVIEKGQFSQTQSADGGDAADPTFATSAELQEYLQFGLKKVLIVEYKL